MNKLRFLSIAIVACAVLLSCKKQNKEQAAASQLQSDPSEWIPVKAGNNYVYVDKNGKIKLNPQINAVNMGNFVDGLAVFEVKRKNVNCNFDEECKSSKFGFIDKNGKIAIEPIYDRATDFNNGFSCVLTNENDPHARGCGDVTGEFNYINKFGKNLLNSNFEPLDCDLKFNNGLAPIKRNNKMGYINSDGQLKIDYKYIIAGNFSEGLACVGVVLENKLVNKFGYIDKNGNFLIYPKFDYADDFSDGVALVSIGGKSFYIDKYGNEIFDKNKLKHYSVRRKFKDGLCVIEAEGLYRFIDKNGKIALNSDGYDYASDFEFGFAIVKLKNSNMCKVINRHGEICKFGNFDEYSEIMLITNNKTIVCMRENGENYMFSLDGKQIWSWK